MLGQSNARKVLPSGNPIAHLRKVLVLLWKVFHKQGNRTSSCIASEQWNSSQSVLSFYGSSFMAVPWLPRGFANIIYSNCQVKVTLQLLKMTLESIETSSKSFIIVINFIVKSIRNQHLIRMLLLLSKLLYFNISTIWKHWPLQVQHDISRF